MLHKHQGKRGTCSHKNTGVADYFAVLGIDSFLPPNASSLDGNAENEINTSNAENDVLLDINECSSSKDTSFGPSDSVNNDAATQDIKIDVTTTRNGNVSTGASALTTENDDIATPKSILDNPTTPEPDEGESKGEEEKMREKRFQREIVQLALCSSVSSLDSRQWTFLDEENQQPSVPKGVLRLFGDASLLHYVNSTIHLAYRRRGENNENKDLNYDDATPMISPNNPHQYYTPAVADVSVCYAKVRSSTIPQFFDKTAHPQHQHLYSNGQHPHFNQQNEQHRQSLPPPPPSSPSSQASSQIPKSIESAVHAAHAVAHGAKQLSSLAKRTGLAAAGKEMAAGLANAVNVGRSIHLGKNRSNPNSNTPNDDVTNDVYNEVGEGSSTNPDQTMHQPPHLYDTGREGSFETALDGATNFQDAHGQVPLWKSGSGIENSVENYSSTPVHDRRGRREHFFPDTPLPESNDGRSDGDAHINGGVITISLADLLPLPDGFDEWVVPDFCEMLHVPTAEYSRQQEILQQQYQQSQHPEAPQASLRRRPILFDRTTSIPSPADRNISDATSPSASSMGVEAMYLSPSTSLMSPDAGASPSNDKAKKGSIGTDSPLLSTASCNISSTSQFKDSTMDSRFLPTLASQKVLPHASHKNTSADSSHHDHVYIPILAFRRQRVGEKERFHEDPAVVDIQITCLDSNGKPPILVEEDDDDDEDGRGSSTMFQNGIHPNILKKSAWIPSCDAHNHTTSPLQQGLPVILLQRNISNGFADLPFPTRVLDRFPQKNYRGMPFPEEEVSLLVRDPTLFAVLNQISSRD